MTYVLAIIVFSIVFFALGYLIGNAEDASDQDYEVQKIEHDLKEFYKKGGNKR